MKIIKYYILQGKDENGNDIPLRKMMDYSDSNLISVKAEAYNGEYTIEDDGVEEVTQPTQEERIKELEEALELLLSGVAE